MLKPFIIAFAIALATGAQVVPVRADEPVYQDILGSWAGTWKSKKYGTTGKVTFSCRRGSSLGPNCTAKIVHVGGTKTSTYEYAPDWKGNGKLEWKNGLLHYNFELMKNGTLFVTYKVRKDYGTWSFKRKQ